ncbi:hypothetical protein V6x_28220 [Gimesia chilikensis]|uniref:Uncharacterized protein n=1 Tax=Gimesia chilikensis TaxID=2605989 RepID=A0A517WCY0_9PLAN|nr:hypothetical protein [Gimesia chilikensis]QDU03110.1 hypothetical protein V6x_28220 [Gimesia chilikensis]
MKASIELEWLQKKIESGDMSPDEPLFVLRARDIFASKVVREWVELANETCFSVAADAPVPFGKIREAENLANEMDAWPIKQTPGRPDTRVDSSAE